MFVLSKMKEIKRALLIIVRSLYRYEHTGNIHKPWQFEAHDYHRENSF